MEGTGNAWALQINPIVLVIAKRNDKVFTDSDWKEGAFAPNGSENNKTRFINSYSKICT